MYTFMGFGCICLLSLLQYHGRQVLQSMEVFMNILRLCHRFTKLFFVAALGLSALGRGFIPMAQAQSAAGKTANVSTAAVSGFHVSGPNLLDANGNNFIMRGVSHPHNWYLEQTSSFARIKTLRANTVRVVLSSGKLWPKDDATDVANVIALCKASRLVCVLEVHDTTGYGQDSEAASLAEAVSYWKEIQSVLTGEEAYVIINIGNEPYGNNNATDWINDMKNAIADMRTAGFQHTLMVDAPNWGQDWEHVMRDNAADILASDPDGNLIFSIHMYGVYDTAQKIEDYVSAFVTAGLPLVIGEFGWDHSDGDPDEDAIMSVAQTYGIGYLGWIWSGDSYLDVVKDFNPNKLTWWGNRIFYGKDGIVETSCEASIYGDGLNVKQCLTSRSLDVADGWILESSETSNKGGSKNNIASTFYLGDNAANKQYRAILSFDTSSLPDNSVVITSVTLMFKYAGISGTNPFTTHGKLLADIREGAFSDDPILQLADFQALAGKNMALSFTNTRLSNWYSRSLIPDDFQFINLTGVTQFRLRFAKGDNNDFGADFLKLYSGNAGVANRPLLIIEYYILP
jgi:mannan endo-1,4-beta-mannosidase